jgi:putative transposase
LFQTEQMANVFVEVLRSYVRAGKFTIHDFVIMPNHIHLLVTLPGTLSLEGAMQLIKGNFSFRANKELGFKGEIWQRGFSDVLVSDKQSFQLHRSYIDNNPVKKGLAKSPEEYRYGSAYFKRQKKIGEEEANDVRAEIFRSGAKALHL